MEMCDVLEKHLPSFGRPPKLCREDRLLMTLMYWCHFASDRRRTVREGILPPPVNLKVARKTEPWARVIPSCVT